MFDVSARGPTSERGPLVRREVLGCGSFECFGDAGGAGTVVEFVEVTLGFPLLSRDVDPGLPAGSG
jgi:hypothetical protein